MDFICILLVCSLFCLCVFFYYVCFNTLLRLLNETLYLFIIYLFFFFYFYFYFIVFRFIFYFLFVFFLGENYLCFCLDISSLLDMSSAVKLSTLPVLTIASSSRPSRVSPHSPDSSSPPFSFFVFSSLLGRSQNRPIFLPLRWHVFPCSL